MGEELLAETIRKSFERLVPLPDALHKRAMRLWREYLLVGGMPQAVADYVEQRDFGEVDLIKRGILQLYSDDIGKFANGDAGRVRGIFAQIPGQLSKHEKRFTLASVDKGARSREYDSAFFWLEDARLVNLCRNSTDPLVGLGLYEDNDSFKCYMCLCSISCCGFSHDDFSGLGRACRPRNGLNWMVLVSPPERTGKDYDQHAPSTVYPSFAAERGIRRVDRAENTCQRADGA
nr:DUF4143 domain-containing protein [Bifidobacterium longum]